MTVIAAIVVGFAERAADGAYDRLLIASALSVADAIQIADGSVTVDVPTTAFSMLAIGKTDRVFHRVFDDTGATVTGYADLDVALRFPRGSDVATADGVFRGFPVRVAANRRLITVEGRPRWVTVAMAETRESREMLAAEIRTYAMVPLIVVGIAAIVMIPLSIRQVLRPVAALERALEARGSADLGPLGLAGVPTEIAPLVRTLDHFVDRLRTTLERNRDFLAEAAHQIRTPLASLMSMAEVASTETDPSELRDQVRRIRRNAEVATRITNQLLADAAVANRLVLGRGEPVRLDRLAAETVNDAYAYSADRSIRFDVAEDAEGAVVSGDPVALREAIRNLLDNALAYAPPSERVDVTVRRTDDGHCVEVIDRGPGIPDADKARVLGRFERGADRSGAGSGLGLAIVARVAAAHGGRVSLRDRPGGGLVAAIHLPARPVPGGPARDGAAPSQR
nr:sensor histidine kinase [Chthonobacter rhizosphaerae]